MTKPREKLIIAYNLYKVEKDRTIKVQMIDPLYKTVIRQVFIPYNYFLGDYLQVKSAIKFTFRKLYKIELPDSWVHLNYTI